MRVISEEKLITYLGSVVRLCGESLPHLSAHGTEPPPKAIRDAYRKLLGELAKEREGDTYLNDESWNWIFQPHEDANLIRLYGRLAWIHLQLLELL